MGEIKLTTEGFWIDGKLFLPASKSNVNEEKTEMKTGITNQQAIEILKDLWRYEHSEFSEKEIREALEKGIIALDTCNSMSKGIPYITVGGKIYKLTDEKGE